MMLTEKYKLWLIYGLSILFILANAVFIYNENYLFLLLPVFIAVVFIAFYSLDIILFLIVLFTPLSLELTLKNFNMGLSLPTEPLMIGASFLFILKLLYEKKINLKVVNHPVSIAVFLSLGWIFITSITSEMPLISFKFLLARLWFVIPFYFMAILLFKNYSNIRRFLLLYIISLSIIVIYTVIRHSFYNFEHKPAHWVMEPFFNDHTSYGAMLAMFFPVLLYLVQTKFSNTIKLIVVAFFLILSVGIIFSYTRAAWLSIIVAFGVAFFYYFRIKFYWMVTGALMVVGLFFAFQSDIKMALEKNRQDSSGDFTKHVQSMSNISSDASNLERLNRWNAASKMFLERPLLGWGPGTYSFQYAPFQHSKDKTIISTNAGDMGNAHSEYIGPLVEQGVLGTFFFVLIIALVYYRSTQVYKRIKNSEQKWLLLSVITGFTTYVVHGFLNNFLDTDKAAVPFWGFIAIIIAMDIYHSSREDEKLPETAAQ
jgi:putative inorganic carbon (hco3(-)) transporter